MLTNDQILELFNKLNSSLKKRKIKGQVFIVGGAAMCLAFKARNSTKDVDAIFAPTAKLREAIEEVAAEARISKDWLNDGVKAYIDKNAPQEMFLSLGNLDLFVPPPEYLFAMKAISARFDSSDKADLIFLIKYMKIKSVESALKIVGMYYPKSRIPAKTQFVLEEIFSPD